MTRSKRARDSCLRRQAAGWWVEGRALAPAVVSVAEQVGAAVVSGAVPEIRMGVKEEPVAKGERRSKPPDGNWAHWSQLTHTKVVRGTDHYYRELGRGVEELLNRSLAERSRTKYSQGWERFKILCREIEYDHFLTGADRRRDEMILVRFIVDQARILAPLMGSYISAIRYHHRTRLALTPPPRD